MTDDRPPLSPDRQAAVEIAAQWLADRPHTATPIPAVIAEFELSVSEACLALKQVEQMRVCRRTFV